MPTASRMLSTFGCHRLKPVVTICITSTGVFACFSYLLKAVRLAGVNMGYLGFKSVNWTFFVYTALYYP